MKKYLFITLALFSLSIAKPAHSSEGCTLVVDNKSGEIITKKGDCDTQLTPVSSFKIPIALMGFEAGILKDAHNPAWEFKEGYTLNKPDDKQTTDPTSWEKNSVVWYSQKITKALGKEKFQEFINKFNYGNKDVSGDKGKNNGLTKAWLVSSLKISAEEQVEFIRNILNKKLGLTEKTYENTIAIIPEFEADNGWKVKGKTGSGWLVDKNGNTDKGHPQGWFVGWAEKDGRVLTFAKLFLGNKKEDSPAGPKARDEFLKELPELVK